jgi:hypothetical protein
VVKDKDFWASFADTLGGGIQGERVSRWFYTALNKERRDAAVAAKKQGHADVSIAIKDNFTAAAVEGELTCKEDLYTYAKFANVRHSRLRDAALRCGADAQQPALATKAMEIVDVKKTESQLSKIWSNKKRKI